jgi:hypothetical protein
MKDIRTEAANASAKRQHKKVKASSYRLAFEFAV